MRSDRLATAALLSLSLLSVGCGSSEEPPKLEQDEFEIVPFESTRVLGDDDLVLLEPDQGDGILRFSEPPPTLADVESGQVVVAGRSEATPHGLLRVVKSVLEEGEGLELETLHAPLQLAFRKVHIRSARRSTGQLGRETWPGSLQPLALDPFQEHVGATQPVNVIVFDGDGDISTTNDQVAVNGELGGAIDFTFRLDFDWGLFENLPEVVETCLSNLLEGNFDCSLDELMPEARAVFVTEPSLAAHLELSGAAMLGFEKEFTLFESNLGQLVYGPVVLTPNVQIVAKVEGDASAQFRASVDAAVAFDTSVTISSKNPGVPDFQPPELREISLDAEPPEVALRASARAGLGAELSLLAYGVAGPFLSTRAFGAIDADVLREPCVQLSAGLEGSMGLKVTTPAILWVDPYELFSWEVEFEPIEEVLDVPVPECEAPPDASTLPPGSGPDAERLAMPTFEPWSRSWSAPFDSAAAITGGSTYWLDQARSIDGRVVVAGRLADALTKIDEDGSLIWSRQLLADADDPNSVLRPARVISTRDAALLVLAEQGLPPLSVVKLTQAGNVLFRRELEIPDPIDCGVLPAGLALDGGSGFFAVVSCRLTRRIHVVHLSETGEVLDATSYADPGADAEDTDVTGLDPMVVTSVGSDLFISGRVSRPLDSMFALRRDELGELVFASRYEACAEGPDVYPVRALVEANGDVTVAGRGGAEHNGFMARLKRDGSVGFAAFPGFGFGAGSVFVIDSIAQLPTTGYVVSASAVQFTGQAPENVPGIALLQLDSVGETVWAQRYAIRSSSGDYASAAQTDMLLTDDGGILVTAAARRDTTGTSAHLWAMKVAAKDGEIVFDSDAAELLPSAGGVVSLPCSLEQVDWEVTSQNEPDVTTRDVPTEALDFELEGARQSQ